MLRGLIRVTALVGLVALFVVGPASARLGRSLATPHTVLASGEFGPGCTTGGSVWCDDRTLDVRLAAASGPIGSGLPVFGAFERVNPANGGTFEGVVTCLGVIGHEAVIGGFGGFVTTPSPLGPFVVYLYDNDLPGGADGISPLSVFGPGEELPAAGFPFTCPSTTSPLGYHPLTTGGVVVR